MAQNAFGRLSRLSVTAARDGERTVLERAAYTAPFKVMHPFYSTPQRMRLMYLTASAGILSGDRQAMDFCAGPGSCLEVFSQSFEKIHAMEPGGMALRTLRLTARAGSCLYYHPQPTIPFGMSAFSARTDLELEGDGRILFWEVLTCGRALRGEKFQYRLYENRVLGRRDGALIYRDCARFVPEQMNLAGLGMYEGFTHLGTLLMLGFPLTAKDSAALRRSVCGLAGLEGAMTQLGSQDYLVRMLGHSAQTLTQSAEALADMLAPYIRPFVSSQNISL